MRQALPRLRALLCATCLPLLARDSRYVAALCPLCADACAAECEKSDDDVMRQCAQACRRAAEECRRLAA